jgi:hypothetical protein
MHPGVFPNDPFVTPLFEEIRNAPVSLAGDTPVRTADDVPVSIVQVAEDVTAALGQEVDGLPFIFISGYGSGRICRWFSL